MRIAIAHLDLAIRALEEDFGPFAAYGFTLPIMRVRDELEEYRTRLSDEPPICDPQPVLIGKKEQV